MKKRDTILLLGIISIIILVAAQVIIIKGIWKTTGEMLPLRYRSLTQEAISTIRGSRSIDPFDTLRFILNDYSDSISKELPLIRDEQKMAEKKKEIFEYFSSALNLEQDLSSYLSSYYGSQGFEEEFNHRIEINNIDIFCPDTINIFRSESFRERRRPERGGMRPPDRIPGPVQDTEPRTSLFNFGWNLEQNYYLLNFTYTIDFSDKRRLILQESAASLLMSIFSIVVVVVI
ncbi:MAG: hypothetical protein IQL11_03290, partial [Bacteroidales bacterium]|nr:hypothetical protein [Bacteroidales bacterium]